MHDLSRAVIDTSVLIYDLFEDSIYHDDASKLLDALSSWIIPSMVIHELIWFLRGLNVDKRLAINAIFQYIIHHKTRIVPIEVDDVTKALNVIKQEGISLSRYNDKVILAVALKLKIPLASFDRKLRNEAIKSGIAVMPKSL